jgi:hypothetical protein
MGPRRYVRVDRDRIEILTPLRKQLRILGAGLLVTAGSATILFIADSALDRAIGWGSTVFFAIVTAFKIRRLLVRRTEPVVVLETDRLRVSRPGAVEVRWEEIAQVLVTNLMGNRFVEIQVRDSDTVRMRTRGSLGRFAMWTNRLFAMAPVVIAANTLPISPDELKAEIETRCARVFAAFPPPRPDRSMT